jgi:hypothetical protein
MHMHQGLMHMHQPCYHRAVRTTVSLPEPLLENAKQCAAERGITLSLLVEDALIRLLAQNTASAAPPFRLRTVRGRLVNPSLDLDRTSALMTMEDEASFRGEGR